MDSLTDNPFDIEHLSRLSPCLVKSYICQNSFHILHINICSFLNKFDQLEVVLASLDVEFSCIVVSETWFEENTFLNQYAIAG